MGGEKDFERRLALIERGVGEIEAAADAGLRATAQQLVQAILELHASGLERVLEIVHGSGEEGQRIIDRLGGDALVSKLLLLHSLHPLSLEARVVRALDDVQPSLRAHHGGVELLGIEDGTVRLRVSGGADVKSTVEGAVLDAAPDVTSLEVEGKEEAIVVGFVSLESLRAPGPTRAPRRTTSASAATLES